MVEGNTQIQEKIRSKVVVTFISTRK